MRNFWRAIVGCTLAALVLLTGLNLALQVHVAVAHGVNDHGHPHEASTTDPTPDHPRSPDHGHDLKQLTAPAVTRMAATTAPVPVLAVALPAPWQAQPEISASRGEIPVSPTLPDPLPGHTVLLI